MRRCPLPDSSDFYPRPPRGGRHDNADILRQRSNFYPRPPRGGRRMYYEATYDGDKFLSTPSARRATFIAQPGNRERLISIHALREEGDAARLPRLVHSRYFYPRPPRGGRLEMVECVGLPNLFLSTPSARRATAARGADAQGVQISIHALREEGDSLPAAQISRLRNFYPRPPRGGRLLDQFLDGIHISISIHALREEGDQEVDAVAALLADFYPRPPRGGRRCWILPFSISSQISIHALREEGDS